MSEETIPVQVPTMDEASKPIIERYNQVWTPTLMLLSPAGDVYHQWNGYLPPKQYLAQLYLGLGKAALQEQRFDAAAQRFQSVADRHPDDPAAAEALYWAAVARYKGSGDSEDLSSGWATLRERYPESEWRTKQSFMEQDA
ncbi:MAG: tetratricopeptide repeat protein [Chloroflexota bacterium]|nr:tetratricopeptide repeat protein [Chloroflexota bacterium]